MGHGIKLTIFPVTDLDKAKAMYTALIGVDPYIDAAYYVGYRVDDQEIGLDPHGHNKGMTGPLNYWEVDDVAKAAQTLVDAGATLDQAAHDVGGGQLIATVKDASGNVIGLRQAS